MENESLNVAMEQFSSLMAGFGVLFGVIILIIVAILVVLIMAEWRMFKKAGKGGWECIVPFYNNWVFVEIAGLNWWWFLLLIATSIVSILFGSNETMKMIGYLAVIFGSFVCNYNLAKKFHKETGFAVLMTIFPIIMYPIIGFGKEYQYDNSVAVSKNGPFPG